MMFKHYGLDHYCISLNKIDFLSEIKKYNLICYDVYTKNNMTMFCIRVSNRKFIKQIFPQAKYMYTSGFIGMIIRNLCTTSHIISYVISVILWCILSNTIFGIEIAGEKDIVSEKLEYSTSKFLYTQKNVEDLKETLLTTFKNDISWLEIYKKGSLLFIRYTSKEKESAMELTNAPLIAKKDGMIAFFDVQAGYKIKKVNDVVHKGDVLVDNKMPNSFDEKIQIDAHGKVYAYTWEKIVVEIKENKIPVAINFFSLLLEARNQIQLQIEEGERIEKENILQFSQNEGTIKIIILYTLLEDITS